MYPFFVIKLALLSAVTWEDHLTRSPSFFVINLCVLGARGVIPPLTISISCVRNLLLTENNVFIKNRTFFNRLGMTVHHDNVYLAAMAIA